MRRLVENCAVHRDGGITNCWIIEFLDWQVIGSVERETTVQRSPGRLTEIYTTTGPILLYNIANFTAQGAGI